MTDTELKEFFAYSLKNAREKAGVTQEEMAQMLGMKQPVINRFESGKSNLTIETIHKYMNALKLDINFSLYKQRGKSKK